MSSVITTRALSTKITIDKDQLLLITEVANSSTFNSVANWNEVELVFKHSSGTIKEAVFVNNGANVFSPVIVSLPKSGTWTLIGVYFSDTTGLALYVTGASIPSGNNIVI